MGKLRPNIVMLGMKTDWHIDDPQEVIDFFDTIQSVIPMPQTNFNNLFLN